MTARQSVDELLVVVHRFALANFRRSGYNRTRPRSSRHASRLVVSLVGMKVNRSVPAATVIPVLIYPDVPEAVAWLTAAFGFVERLRIGENHRSQLSVGDGAVIVAEPGGYHRPPSREAVAQYVMVRVPDAQSHCERARAHGAVILGEPADYMMASGSMAPRISPAIGGRSPRRYRTQTRKRGAVST